MIKHNRTKKQIKEAIRHWKEDHKKLKRFGGTSHAFYDVFSSNRCAICDPFWRCEECPLPTKAEIEYDIESGCSHKKAPYSHARKAYNCGNITKFHANRWIIIKRLQRALARMEKKK